MQIERGDIPEKPSRLGNQRKFGWIERRGVRPEHHDDRFLIHHREFSAYADGCLRDSLRQFLVLTRGNAEWQILRILPPVISERIIQSIDQEICPGDGFIKAIP